MTLRMTPQFFHVLLSLVPGPRHGYGIKLEVEDRTNGRVKVGFSSLYYVLARLEKAGLIEEVVHESESDDVPHENRRRYYALTEPGRVHLEREAATLAAIVNDARAQGVLP